MKYDFDTLVERRGTHCCKFDTIPEEAGKNAIPVSIADMDLPCAEPIIRALHERIDQRIFGYTVYENEDCKEAVTGWYRKRFGWEIDKNDIFFSPGVLWLEKAAPMRWISMIWIENSPMRIRRE